MKKFFMLMCGVLPMAMAHANTVMQFNPTQGNVQPIFVNVNYCATGTNTWLGCDGGIFIAINPHQQLNVESTCSIPVTATAYQVNFASQTITQSCLTANGRGVISQSNPNLPPTLSGSFFGNGINCGTPCG